MSEVVFSNPIEISEAVAGDRWIAMCELCGAMVEVSNTDTDDRSETQHRLWHQRLEQTLQGIPPRDMRTPQGYIYVGYNPEAQLVTITPRNGGPVETIHANRVRYEGGPDAVHDQPWSEVHERLKRWAEIRGTDKEPKPKNISGRPMTDEEKKGL